MRVFASALVALLYLGCGGGQPQFVTAFPGVKSMPEQLDAGATKLGCTASPSGPRATLVKCPEKRIVVVSDDGNDYYQLTCYSGTEATCKAFVNELLAAGK